jgi:hypothetical protein
MHFLGASRDGLVARRVDLDTISSSVHSENLRKSSQNDDDTSLLGYFVNVLG